MWTQEQLKCTFDVFQEPRWGRRALPFVFESETEILIFSLSHRVLKMLFLVSLSRQSRLIWGIKMALILWNAN